MQFKTSTAAVLAIVLATFAQCTPITANPVAPDTVGLTKRGPNECGDSTFLDQGSGASPWITDCERMRNNLAGPGAWSFTSFQSNKQLASYGTCAFTVSWAQIFQGSVMIGTEDVRDLIRDSIAKFRRSDGKVGAKGTMPCGPQNIQIAWGLH